MYVFSVVGKEGIGKLNLDAYGILQVSDRRDAGVAQWQSSGFVNLRPSVRPRPPALFIHHNLPTVFAPVIKLLRKSLLLAIFAGIITNVREKNTTSAPRSRFNAVQHVVWNKEVSVWQQTTTLAVLHSLWNSTSAKWMS